MREEAGIEVELKGILRYMQMVGTDEEGQLPLGEAKTAMVFYAEPTSIE